MYIVYFLYSPSGAKTYIGFTNDLERRFHEHNVSEKSGFTLRYRPWILLRQEKYSTKIDAMTREKFLKTGRGREEVKQHVIKYLDDAVSAAAEMD